MTYYVNQKDILFDNEPSLVFIDYESWFYGFLNQYKRSTDIMEWIKDVKTRGAINDFYVFGDFTDEKMKNEASRWRNVTTNIIDCSKNTYQKDYTDFIMLDQIYQKSVKSPHIKQFILFTGDGHFQSAVAFLKTFQDKTVGIYGVKGTISQQLMEAANWYVEVEPQTLLQSSPQETEGDAEKHKLAELIKNNLRWVENKGVILPTYKKTLDVICRQNEDINQEKLAAVLQDMINKGCIRQVPRLTKDGSNIVVMETDWGALSHYHS
ncbi:MAG: NYN domain-containing protein [Clostridiales bacterium]